jgi:hypothetical protein
MSNRWARIIAPFIRRISWIQRILVTAIAASVAWLVGNEALPNGGLVAAIVATLTVRISLNKSIREGMGQLLGTAIGVATALISSHFLGFGVVTVFVTVILSLVASRALHLGEVASINVPITALIVLGPGLAESRALHRTLSTLIGTSIAIAFSYFAHPKTPAGRTIDRISGLAEKCAQLLGEMAEAVVAGYTQEIASSVLAKARLLIEEIPQVRAQALEARSYARWFPTAKRDEAEDLYARGLAVEHTVVQVRSIARTLFDSAFEEPLPQGTAIYLAMALSSASFAISQAGRAVRENAEVIVGQSVTSELRLATSTLAQELMTQVKRMEMGQFTRGISLVTNLERIADSLDLDTPAITEVQTPEVLESEVLSLSPIEQGRKMRRKISRVFGRPKK